MLIIEHQKITPYFKGGTGTDAFKAFENNGFKIVPKNKSLLAKYLQEFSDESDEWFRKMIGLYLNIISFSLF